MGERLEALLARKQFACSLLSKRYNQALVQSNLQLTENSLKDLHVFQRTHL